ncbi:MAG TPA: hypothetical protein DDY78_02705 [Planctomycetales bacterium]|jgi:hypothetical protein|nr:hypothetical protein [Planctomycetales bacterium]
MAKSGKRIRAICKAMEEAVASASESELQSWADAGWEPGLEQNQREFKALCQLNLFERFLQNLHDIEEGYPAPPQTVGGSLENDCWQNRLGWTWHHLLEYADAMGPEYVEVVPCYYPEDPAPADDTFESANRV